MMIRRHIYLYLPLHFLYTLLAWYLDHVLPSQYGVNKTPWFCLKPSYWCPSISSSSSCCRFTGRLSVGPCGASGAAAASLPLPRPLRSLEALEDSDSVDAFGGADRSGGGRGTEGGTGGGQAPLAPLGALGPLDLQVQIVK